MKTLFSSIAGGALALFAVTASAVDHIVTALPARTFDPPTLTIDVGDTVTFVNGGGFHNAQSDDGSITTFRCANGCDESGGNGDPDDNDWSGTVTFPTAGTVLYHCEQHGGNGGAGMSGSITIVGGGTGPVIGVDPTSLAGSADAGQSTTVPLAISNGGDADLTWTADMASADCATPDIVPWIALDPASGTVVSGDPAQTIDVTLDATELAAGVYNANVCVHSNDAANDLVSLPVEFTVNAVDVIFIDGFDNP